MMWKGGPPRPARPVVQVLLLVPLAMGIWGVISDLFFGTRWFGSNPIKEVEHWTGKWTLRLLMVTLAITPARRITGWNWLQRYRRMVGVTAFFYAMVHLLIYFMLDVELSWRELVTDILKRPYITIGMLAFLLLTPLAVTSTSAMIKRLGGKRWARLHRLIYVVVVLGTIHFWMAVKKDTTEPMVYALIFAVLLGYRILNHLQALAKHGDFRSGETPRH